MRVQNIVRLNRCRMVKNRGSSVAWSVRPGRMRIFQIIGDNPPASTTSRPSHLTITSQSGTLYDLTSTAAITDGRATSVRVSFIVAGAQVCFSRGKS